MTKNKEQRVEDFVVALDGNLVVGDFVYTKPVITAISGWEFTNATAWVFDDGGRRDCGWIVHPKGDCVCRAIAIATQQPYRKIYDELYALSLTERRSDLYPRSHPEHGIHTEKPWFRRYMGELGFSWVPRMHIGSGCTVHLNRQEMPAGRLVVSVAGHLTAMIDGVIRDTHDPSKQGKACVYGYWLLK